MDAQFAQELLNELASAMEDLETQQAALLRFLKDKGIVAEDEMRRYLTEAGDASNIRWRAARVRLEHLITAADKAPQPEQPAISKSPEEEQPQQQASDESEAEQKPEAKREKAEGPNEKKEEAAGEANPPRQQPGEEDRKRADEKSAA